MSARPAISAGGRKRIGHWATLCVVALGLAAVGCGNRLSREELLAQNMVREKSASERASGSADRGGIDSGANGVQGSEASPADPVAGVRTDAGAGSAGVGGVSTPTTAAANDARTPIVIGMVGWFGGVGASTNGDTRDGLVAWSKAVNARGGIKGHPVKLLIGDDGANESRSLSIVRDFVENKGAVAIVNYSGLTAAAVSQYAAKRGVPIIGGLVIEQLWNANPMMFPNTATPDGSMWGSARLTLDSGASKAAIVYCAEVAGCQQAKDYFVGHAREMGLTVAYEGRVSLTQPDYTAECLQMKNSGVQAVVPFIENAALVRLAQSCSRQDFRPTYVTTAPNSAMAKLPEFQGSIGALVSFPWFLRSGSPVVEEYGQALERYFPGRIASGTDFLSRGWLGGKVFEFAAAKVSAKPTTEDILNGLWTMQRETFGGLTPGGTARTFRRSQPTAETYCVFFAKVADEKWTAPNGLSPVCR